MGVCYFARVFLPPHLHLWHRGRERPPCTRRRPLAAEPAPGDPIAQGQPSSGLGFPPGGPWPCAQPYFNTPTEGEPWQGRSV